MYEEILFSKLLEGLTFGLYLRMLLRSLKTF